MTHRPEILAPAGDRDALAAALAAGADAVYFGLDDGFNARARATNFATDQLAEVVEWVHRAGVRAYVTLNTLVFEPELATVAALIAKVAAAGVDAIIVQDPAVALIARAIAPALEVHASTQMTIASPLAAELMRELGLSRVVVPRELSLADIAAFRAASDLPLEVFVHGALCVAWSGQCLSSEAWGGRSANRGQCAQACRLPYRLIVDGEPRDLGDVAYLLSPKDLVGLDHVAALAELGVASLKIEGRLKGPAYVASAVAAYREAVVTGQPPADRGGLQIAYSRGVSAGFLGGADHQTLVEGRFPRHRGLPIGRVIRVEPDAVVVERDPAQRPGTGGLAIGHARTAAATLDYALPRAGMGVVFDRGAPEQPEEGGPIFAVEQLSHRGPDRFRLTFGDPGPALSRVAADNFVWATSDPAVTRTGDAAVAAGRRPLGRLAVSIAVSGAIDQPLIARARCGRRTAHAQTTAVLTAARGSGLDAAILTAKLGALGGTDFHLAELDTSGLAPNLAIAVSELKALRRALVAALTPATDAAPPAIAPAAAAPAAPDAATTATAPSSPPVLVVLCRSDEQLAAALAAGARDIELDWMELVGLGRAVSRARAAGARIGVATTRITKPTEHKIDAHLASLAPDYILVRSWGSLAYFRHHASELELHGDFSLNITNSRSAAWVLARGLATVTAAHDLDRAQLAALLAATRQPWRIAVTIHHHIPTFHTEHCVYAHLLSTGRDYRTCGRPCERHAVSLGDRVGMVHPVVVDVGCRNTVFNAQAQSAAGLVPGLVATGVRRFRVELVRESAAETRTLVETYRELVGGALAPEQAIRRAAVHEQFGVTRGTMRTLTVIT